MACPACSRRALSLFIESASGLNATSTLLRPRRLPPTSAPLPLRQQAHPRALSTRSALQNPASFRLPDARQIYGAGADKNGSRDAIVPSNISPEPWTPAAEQRLDADTIAAGDGGHAMENVGAAADSDPAELRKDLALLQGLSEKDVQHRLWVLTNGRSGSRPPKTEVKQSRKDRKARRKLEKQQKAELGSGEQSAEKTEGVPAVGEIVIKGGYPRVVAYENTKRKASVKLEPWKVQKEALKQKFGEEGWQPRKKLSPDAMDGIRTLHKSEPEKYSTAVLAAEFKVSPEAIRRILRSKWQPNEEQEEKRMKRWEKRGEKIYQAQVEKGMKPPKKWREKGVGSVYGGKHEVPAWKQKRGQKGRGRREEREPAPDFSRPRGPGADYGDVGGWNDRIL